MSSPADPLAWVRWAEEDYSLAIIALRRAQPFTYGACFHAQQAAEKYLKAILVARGVAFPRTHDLGTLFTLLPPGGAALTVPPVDLQLLAGHAVDVRYPGLMPTRQDARQSILIAGRVRRECRRMLGLP
jgi:HEPN domain-containing protein